MDLNQPIESIRNIGPAYLKRLKRLQIKNLRDLFFHFPHRYDDFSNIKNINDVKIDENVTIEGRVKKINSRMTFRRGLSVTEAIIEDKSGVIKSVWFNQPYLVETLSQETLVSLAGKVKKNKDGIFLSNPAYEKIIGDDLKHTQGLVPIYPETEGLSSRWLRFVIYPLLKKNLSEFKEFLPEEILKEKNLPTVQKAIFNIHFPPSIKEAGDAKKRFAFEELFLIQLILQKQKKKMASQKSPKLIPKIEYIEEFKKQLGFNLTEDQKKSIREILDDLQKEFPMSRLLEGEVGCGKTIVATLASFVAFKNNYQAAIMAPTGILAEQHFLEISKLLKTLNIKIALLTSEKAILASKGKKQKLGAEKIIEKTKNGETNILIGTHSLIQERMNFKKLGLIVVDEQHRFGVEQRAKLTIKNKEEENIPHFLSMTATPIPRTLALAFYGDLSISQIKELPKGRKKIETKIVPPKGRNQIYEFLRKEVNEGKQAFVICPLIEESEKLQVTAAKKEFERLKTKIFPDLKLGLLHGRMKAKEKEEIMKNFKSKKIQVLVSTPVVEVGIDVPNATVMIIEGADRFGLSQLYQFRGRVGRGEAQSYCFLFTDSTSGTTKQRLKAIETAKDAFELSEKDLKIRGAGDFIGRRQSGIPDLTMSSLTDVSLIKEAKKEAENLLLKDPQFKKHPLLSEKLKDFKKEVFFE